LTSGADAGDVLSLTHDLHRADHLLASIEAISEKTCTLVLDAATGAARADASGKVSVVVDQICRLAVGVSVATGELAWLAAEIESSLPNGHQLAEAAVAIAGLHVSVLGMAFAVQEVADAGGPAEIAHSAEALRRAGLHLEALLPALRPSA
jgi:methyl-accepting chemotaxis protein